MEYLPKVFAIIAFDAMKDVCFTRSFRALDRCMRQSAEEYATEALDLLSKTFNFFNDTSMTKRQSQTRIYSEENALFYFRQIEDIILCIVASPNENEIFVAKLVSCIEQSMAFLIPDRSLINKETFRLDVDTFTFVIDAVIDDGVVISIDPQRVVSQVKPFVLAKSASQQITKMATP